MAFLSDTDLEALQSEGNDTNCTVSLVVDTKGTYVAAITRKVVQKKKITVETSSLSYEFFGEGRVSTGLPSENTQEQEETVIEYFMLDVDIEHVDNPLAYLDDRFNIIESRKKTLPQPVSRTPYTPISHTSNPAWDKDGSLIRNKVNEDEDFYDYLHSERENPAGYKEPALFSEEEIDITKWNPDPTVIHHAVICLITCSFITSPNVDLKQWVHSHMVRKYESIFPDEVAFSEWKDFIIEFLFNNYVRQDVPLELSDNFDIWQSKVAEAMLDEISQYSTNNYMDQYINQLTEYIISY